MTMELDQKTIIDSAVGILTSIKPKRERAAITSALKVLRRVYPREIIRDLGGLAKTHQFVLKDRLSLESRKQKLLERGDEFTMDWVIGILQNLETNLEDVISVTYQTHVLCPYLTRLPGAGMELAAKFLGFIEAVEEYLVLTSADIPPRTLAKIKNLTKKGPKGTIKLVRRVEWYGGQQRISCVDKKTAEKVQTLLGKKVTSHIQFRHGIECFDTLSRFWAFSGWGLPKTKTAGEKLAFNPELKAHCWKIATSFSKQKGKNKLNAFYEDRKLVETSKFQAVIKAEKIDDTYSYIWEGKKIQGKNLPVGVTTELHIHRRAQRALIKLFLALVYYKWRELLELPCRPTYAEEKLDHHTRYELEDYLN